MEDAATAEISRSQIWQWINAGVEFENGETVQATPELARKVAAEELAAIREEVGEEAFAAGQLAAGPRPAAAGRPGRGLRGLPDAARVRAAGRLTAAPPPAGPVPSTAPRAISLLSSATTLPCPTLMCCHCFVRSILRAVLRGRQQLMFGKASVCGARSGC